MKSPLYYNGYIYELLIGFRHGRERLKIINKIVNNKRVLELGCGTGINGEFLDCDYCGYDLNHNFIRYGKNKNRNVIHGDAFNVKLDKYDIICVIDFLHHVKDHKFIMKKLIKSKKELVICEPFIREFNNKHIGRVYHKLNEWVDSDGINKPVKWYTKAQLIQFFNSFGKCKIYQTKKGIIAHFRK